MENEQKSQNAENDVVDIEEYAREGKEVPEGKRYGIRIDKDKYVVTHATITGKEILALAGKTPETHNLYQHSRGGQSKVVGAEETVNLTEKGVERFTTMKRANTEG